MATPVGHDRPPGPVSAAGIRRVAVVGAGAMGAMYAAHFAAAGFDVALVARGERARRLRAEPPVVNGIPLRADVVDLDAPAGAGVADLVLVAVKDRHLAAAIAGLSPIVGGHTTFVSVMNGLDSEETIAQSYGAERVLLCVALAMDARKDGREVAFRQSGRLVLGPMVAAGQGRVAAVVDALGRAGLASETPADMRHRRWWKFMVNVGINQASAVLRAPYDAFQHEGPARSLMAALMDEVIAVGAAEGVDLGPADLRAWEEVLAGQPADGWTSMHQDIAAGRSTEVDSFAGRVVALGERHGIPTPVNRTMLWILRALEEG